MKSMAVVLIVLCLACVTRSDSAFAEEYGDPDDPSERLVSDLTEIDTPAPGLAGMGVYSIFMAADEEPKFLMGVLGVPSPAVPPQMRELVRRGLAALPVLIRHLGDRRPTKLTIEEHHILMNRRFGDEYDPRIRPACDSACIKELIKREQLWAPIGGGYQVKIGDVCFVLVGQIVNRNLNAVRYQPSGNLYVNSPVVTPSLAEKVRADWAGLDAQGHEASLRADLKTRPFPGEALIRLRFYYPNAYAALDGDDARKREKFEAEEKKARETKAGANTP
jgi:hypothetical protein